MDLRVQRMATLVVTARSSTAAQVVVRKRATATSRKKTSQPCASGFVRRIPTADLATAALIPAFVTRMAQVAAERSAARLQAARQMKFAPALGFASSKHLIFHQERSQTARESGRTLHSARPMVATMHARISSSWTQEEPIAIGTIR